LRRPWLTGLVLALLSWPASATAQAPDGRCPPPQRECLSAGPVHFCIEACLTRTCLDAVEMYFDCARDSGCAHGDDACAARVCPDTCMEMADEASCLAWQAGEPGFGALVLQRFADENEPPPPPPAGPPPPPPVEPPPPSAAGIQIVDLQIAVASTGASTDDLVDLPITTAVGGTCPAALAEATLADLPDRLRRCLACGDVSDVHGPQRLDLTWRHEGAAPLDIEVREGSAWHGHLRFCALAVVREVRNESALDEGCSLDLSLELTFPEP